jgi:hypothetical protein
MIPDTIIVGVISMAGGIAVGLLGAKASKTNADKTLHGTERQLTLTHAIKIAEFRQAWINDLRDSMAKFHSLGILEGALRNAEFYRLGTKIELLMDRKDPRYDRLNKLMYSFYDATSGAERLLCNAPFVEVSQDILKTEWEKLKADLAKAAAPAAKIVSHIS